MRCSPYSLIQLLKKRIKDAIPLPEEIELTDRLRVGMKLADLKFEDEVLDLGCSYGYLESLVLSEMCHSVIGVDIDKEAIRLAKRKCKGFSNTHFIVVDIEKGLPFRSEIFKKVLFLDVLEHLKDDETILKEINRVLKKNGVLIISVPHKYWHPMRILDSLLNVREREYNLADLKSKLERSGFLKSIISLVEGQEV